MLWLKKSIRKDERRSLDIGHSIFPEFLLGRKNRWDLAVKAPVLNFVLNQSFTDLHVTVKWLQECRYLLQMFIYFTVP